ncbi:MAG TPA: histidinol phosphate phosphatase, partial [Bacillota bacterium]|nr:histidinol phosphate phosphatase [Bacillota bacterium]
DGEKRFDTVAHITYPCRYYIANGRTDLLDMNKANEAFAELFRFLITNGIALECNTSGLHQAIGRTLPDEKILSLYRQLGGELLTTGSDAHRTEHIGYRMKDTYRMLTSIGFRYVTVYENRVPEMKSIV